MTVAAALLTVALVVYNNVANRWPSFNAWAYVPMNAAAALALLGAGAATGLTGDDMGLRWSERAWVGLVPGVAAAVVVATALVARPTLVADARLAGVRGRAAAFMVLVRIPIGTAAFEEIAFRGVLLAAWAHAGTGAAVAISSIAFGLWHIAPTASMARSNRPERSPVPWVIAGVLATTIAGAALCWLRLWSDSLVAPFLAHASINSIGASGAIAAHRALSR